MLSRNNLKNLDEYIAGARPDFEATLKKLVNIPSVSADPKHKSDIIRTAKYAAALLRESGFTASLVPTSGNPVVLGEFTQDKSFPTLMLYNHLDVQPANPKEWDTPPFNLTSRNGIYFGRGATDDKGPAITALWAIRYAMRHKFHLNFKVVWEFEEEIGSIHFEEFVKANKDRLATDSVLVSDTIWIAADKPAIPVGLRGLVTFEVHLRTGNKDTHSGLTGGAARNPLGEMAQIVTECYDAATGKVLVPGFYDDIVPATKSEIQDFVNSGFSVAEFKKDHELLSLRTDDPAEVLSRIMAEPTFEVHGITGGYSGPGIKTVVPYSATAKISTRLVPGQDPDRIMKLIRTYIIDRHPDATFTVEAACPPYLADTGGSLAKAASDATVYAFGAKPAFVREGGSIGAVLTMHSLLKAPVMLLGLSLPGHGYHAINEHYDWGQASGGIKLFAHYFERLTQIQTKAQKGRANKAIS